MSAFLGQIHYWLYKKIQLLHQRESLILKEAQQRLDDLAEEMHAVAIDMYGKPIPADRDLRMIIDHNNIHGWLQQQLETASVREATFIKDLLDVGGEEAVDAILEAFLQHGMQCGMEGRETLTDHTATGIHKALQDYYVNGMPCDPADTILVSTEDEVQWVGDHHNQVASWKKAGVNQVFMAAAYQSWFNAFVTTIDKDFVFSVNLDGELPLYSIRRNA